jgi:hypothetical protein
MAESVVVEQSSVPVVPGETATCTVRIRNTGSVIDQFTLTVLGQPAAWTTVVPAALSLFPNADGTIELHFAPPRAPGIGNGPIPFGVRVVGSEDPDNPAVEEGEVNLLPFVDVNAKLTPRTTETKRKSRHEIILDNKGNTPVAVTLTVSDPDEQLAFGLDESLITVQAGQSAHVPLKVAAKKGFARGSDKHRPFQVKALPEGGAYPLTMDGNLIQKPGMPRFILPLVAGIVALGLLAALLPALKKDGGKGNLQLASEDAPVTTVAEAPAADDAGNPEDGPATPEEAQAAAAAELAANGKDPNAPESGGGSSGGGETSAAGSGAASAAGSGGNTGGNTGGEESPAVTSPSATTAPPPPAGGGTTATTAASTTTSTPPSTTTTVPSTNGAVRGTWTFDFDTGVEGASGSDVWWNQLSSTNRQLQPYTSGAMLFNMGAANYDAVTKAQLQGLAYSTTPINGSDSGNQMPPGTVIAIKTNTGRYAKMKVIAKDAANTLTFRYYTYP